MSGEETFLQRWSRLKRGTAVPESADAAFSEEEEAKGSVSPDVADGDAAPLDLTTLPSLDSITAETDIRAFLDVRVPAGLRNEALRRMWTADPVIRDFIEVAENQGNWNVPGGVPGHGPLAEGTDVAALVAQAMGLAARAAGAAGPNENVTTTAGLLDPRSAAVEHDVSTSVPADSIAVKESLSFNVLDRVSEDPGRSEWPPAETRLGGRRHGTALPG